MPKCVKSSFMLYNVEPFLVLEILKASTCIWIINIHCMIRNVLRFIKLINDWVFCSILQYSLIDHDVNLLVVIDLGVQDVDSVLNFQMSWILEKMNHFWNDSLMNLSEPNLDICALSHSSISKKTFSLWTFPYGHLRTKDILRVHLFLNVLKDYRILCNLHWLTSLTSCD